MRLQGSLLLGTIFAAMLFSQEFVLFVRYFRERGAGPDPLRLKIGLGLLFVNDCVSTAAQIGGVYSYCISHWGDVGFLSRLLWIYPTYRKSVSQSVAF